MATNYPTSLDNFTNPASTDLMNSVTVPHNEQHANANDAIEALQAKVGADSSAVTSSHDYKIADHASRLTTLESDVAGLVTGKILQVVQTVKDDTFSTATTGSYVDITGLTATITPSSTTAKVLVMVEIGHADCTVDANYYFDVQRDSTSIGIGAAAGSRTRAGFGTTNSASAGNRPKTVSWKYLDSPAQATATVYKVRLYPTNGTTVINRSSADSDQAVYARTVSTITLMEVSA